jgi:hypothetical protein
MRTCDERRKKGCQLGVARNERKIAKANSCTQYPQFKFDEAPPNAVSSVLSPGQPLPVVEINCDRTSSYDPKYQILLLATAEGHLLDNFRNETKD